MRVVGLDLSLSSVGVALPGGRLHTIEPAHGADDRIARVDEICNRLIDVVRQGEVVAGRFRIVPDLAVIEGYNPRGHQGMTMAKLAELGGCVRLWLYRSGCAVVEVPPKTLKKYATGNGNASKDQMIEALPPQVVARNDDEADAWWLRQIGVEWASRVPGPRADVVAGLAWPTRVVA